jgi:CubicO group peptidase (beta-lactamase class C family)
MSIQNPVYYTSVFQLSILLILGISSLSGQHYAHWEHVADLQQQKNLASSSVLLNNEQGTIPVKNLEQKIAVVHIGIFNASAFDSLLNKYAAVTSFSANGSETAFIDLSLDLKFYNTVIVTMTGAALKEKKNLEFLYDVQKSKHLILVLFGHPEGLGYAGRISLPVILTEDDSPAAANFAAQLIFGGVSAKGKLACTWSEKYRKNDGFMTTATRLHYTVPEEVDIAFLDIEPRVDAVVAEAIQGKAIPGAVVMVVKDGNVIFNKSYGTHSYDTSAATKISDLFDMASITKVSASTLATMRLYEQNKVHLDSSFGYYIPTARNTDKHNITIRNLLLHQSGIASGVALPVLPTDISPDSSADFPVKAGNGVFIRKGFFKDFVWPRMVNVTVESPKYLYSDLSMTYMKEVIENQSGNKLDHYVSQQFYQPLGMQTAGFNPLDRFPLSRIVPTEKDADFRKGLLHGFVHDPMAAKLGGVSGNAGLFASANDLAILYQMVLNKGTYGGLRYFSPQTIQLFTSKQSATSRRGLGFDRVDTSNKLGYPSRLASAQTYGHTGFTGTCFWVDPKYNLVYIFLSNRVHPTVNGNLYKLRTQAKILDAFYEVILKTSVKKQ